jgi:bacterioferritin-associated ferredoxin
MGRSRLRPRPLLRVSRNACSITGMIVCSCNAIRERDVRAAARQGHRDPLSAYRSLGRRPRCGQCIPFARDVIAAECATA